MMALKAAGAAAVLGTGLYYGPVYYEVYQAEKERDALVNQHNQAQVELVSWSGAIEAAQRKEQELKQQAEQAAKTSISFDARLAEARAAVSRLEAEKGAAEAAAAEAAAGIQEAREYAARLRKRVEASAETIALLEKSIGSSRAHVSDARQLLNPLRHPVARQYLEQWQQR